MMKIAKRTAGAGMLLCLFGLVCAAPAQATKPPTVSSASLAFPNEVFGVTGVTSAAKTVTIKNPKARYGGATVTGLSYSSNDSPEFLVMVPLGSTTDCSLLSPAGTLAAGASCTVSLTFTPHGLSSRKGTLTITDNPGSTTVGSVALSGTGIKGSLTFSAKTLAFGKVQEGTPSATKTVTLTNPNSVALSITSMTPPSADFAISANTCGSSLAASGSCAISVVWTPSGLGALSGQSLAIADDAAGSPQSVALTGTGTLAEATISPASLLFGSVPVGTVSAAQTITLRNPNTEVALTLGTRPVTGDFAISADTCGSSLAASGSCTISVTFDPPAATATGTTLTGTLTIPDNAVTNPRVVNLTGSAVVPNPTVSPRALYFRFVPVGTVSAVQTVTLTNNNAVALTLGTRSVTGDFAISTDNCGSSLAPSASCTISMTFNPPTTYTGTSLTGTLTIPDNAVTNPQVVTLHGTGDLLLFAANYSGNSASAYLLGSNGNVPSLLPGAFPTPSVAPEGIALDSSRNVYVLNNTGGADGAGSITEYAPGNDPNTAGPIATISNDPTYTCSSAPCSSSGLDTPHGIALDSSGNIYVTNGGNAYAPGAAYVTVYPSGSSGTSPLYSSFLDAIGGLPYGIAVDSGGNIYTADYNSSSYGTGLAYVIEYPPGGGTPSAYISGADTRLQETPNGVAVDSSGNIYVTSCTLCNGTDDIVTIYTASAVTAANTPGGGVNLLGNGDAAPTAYITGAYTGLYTAKGIALDPNGNIYVANWANLTPSITEYPPLASLSTQAGYPNVGPITTITGAATLLNGPWGIAIGPNYP